MLTGGHTALRTQEEGRRLVLDVLRDNADSLLAVARRHSLCLDDAQDAYQRALEIFLRHAVRLEEEGAPRWIHTVVKHEAMRLRATRQRLVASEELDLDLQEARHLPDAEERVLAFDRMTRSAEALQRLKPQEVQALWLRAQGLSYNEIAETCGWTYTKVNRCVTEGRRSFLQRYAGIEAGEECERWAPVLSALVDGEASAEDLAAVRPHLRNCGVCRATMRELHESRPAIAAVLPLPAAAAVAGHDHAGAATTWLGRAWELLSGPFHERAVLSATKLQAAVETASAGKVAAVAASAAALAGGGVAVDHAVVRASGHGHPAVRAAFVQPPASSSSLAGHPSAPAAPRPSRGSSSKPPARTEFPSASGGAAAKEFALGGPGGSSDAASGTAAKMAEFRAAGTAGSSSPSAAEPSGTTWSSPAAGPSGASPSSQTSSSNPSSGASPAPGSSRSEGGAVAAAAPPASSSQAAAEFGP